MNILRRLGLINANRINGMIALGIVAMIVLGCNCQKSLGDAANSSTTASNKSNDTPFGSDGDKMPDDTLLRALVNETTADFALAISTGDFSKIHEKASIDFQKSIPEEKLEREFKVFVNSKSRYLPSLAKISSTKAEFDPTPSLRSEQGLDIVMAKGKYATTPLDIEFDYEYVKRDGRWKLLKLIVKM